MIEIKMNFNEEGPCRQLLQTWISKYKMGEKFAIGVTQYGVACKYWNIIFEEYLDKYLKYISKCFNIIK